MTANPAPHIHKAPDTQQALDLLTELEERLSRLKDWQKDNENHLARIQEETLWLTQQHTEVEAQSARLKTQQQQLQEQNARLIERERTLKDEAATLEQRRELIEEQGAQLTQGQAAL